MKKSEIFEMAVIYNHLKAEVIGVKQRLICELSGGLGNQMFCYACGLAFSKMISLKLYIDASAYCHDAFGRKFELGYFNISSEEVKLSRKNIINKFIRKMILVPYLKISSVGCMKQLESMSRIVGKKIFLDYKWHNQDYRLFHNIKDEIKDQFVYIGSLSNNYKKLYNDYVQYCTVAIHFRFGDYVGIGCCLDEGYYKKAVSKLMMDKKFCQKNQPVKIMVFSEDIKRAKKIIEACDINFQVSYIDKSLGLTDLEEFWLMKSCNHLIISNSTFSWWAAYLGENKDSIIIAPIVRNWIKGCWEEDYFPKEWDTVEACLLKG